MHDNQGKLQEGENEVSKRKIAYCELSNISTRMKLSRDFLQKKTQADKRAARHGIEHANIHKCTAYLSIYTQELRKWLKFPDCYPDLYTSYIRNITMAKS